jgi:hypothetical protein
MTGVDETKAYFRMRFRGGRGLTIGGGWEVFVPCDAPSA